MARNKPLCLHMCLASIPDFQETQFYLFYALLSDFLDEMKLSLLEVAHFHNLYMLFY